MAEPVQPVLSKQHVHGWKASACKDSEIWHFVAQFDAKDTSKEVFSLHSCLVYVVQALLPYSSVLMMQALYTAILVGFSHSRKSA